MTVSLPDLPYAKDALAPHVEGTAGERVTNGRVLCSVAADAEQVDAYARLAASLGARNVSVCEIGFNVGHSAAVWLTSNPHLTLHTFDIFGKNDRAKRRCLELLQEHFPNRIVAHAGEHIAQRLALFRRCLDAHHLVHGIADEAEQCERNEGHRDHHQDGLEETADRKG